MRRENVFDLPIYARGLTLPTGEHIECRRIGALDCLTITTPRLHPATEVTRIAPDTPLPPPGYFYAIPQCLARYEGITSLVNAIPDGALAGWSLGPGNAVTICRPGKAGLSEAAGLPEAGLNREVGVFELPGGSGSGLLFGREHIPDNSPFSVSCLVRLREPLEYDYTYDARGVYNPFRTYLLRSDDGERFTWDGPGDIAPLLGFCSPHLHPGWSETVTYPWAPWNENFVKNVEQLAGAKRLTDQVCAEAPLLAGKAYTDALGQAYPHPYGFMLDTWVATAAATRTVQAASAALSGSAILYPAASTDTGYANNVGEYFATGLDAKFCEIGKYGTNRDRAWIRIALTGIPAGGNIGSAVLTLTAYSTQSAATCSILVGAVAANNPSSPTSKTEAFALSVMDGAKAWGPGAWTDGATYSVDITSVIQAVVNRPDYSAGEHVPGLILDRFGDVAVLQANTAGIERLRETVAEAISAELRPTAVIARNDTAARDLEGLPRQVDVLAGTAPDRLDIDEDGATFTVPALSGQKTGWFYDMRESRSRLCRYVRGRRVLDLFAYAGAFSVRAALAGAASVTCLDSSDTACRMEPFEETMDEPYSSCLTIQELLQYLFR